MGQRPNTPSDFWKFVKKTDGCWTWTGGRRSQMGYGHFSIAGGSVSAHRFSWELHFGDVPEGLQVLHRCDNPVCVKPDHLFTGTHQDNMDDRGAKNRTARRGNRRLTDEQVSAIRAARNSGTSLKDIAERFRISVSAVSVIARGLRRANG